jgi:hypothetical protein
MKKLYAAPRLLNHGTVSEITAESLDSNKSDFIYGTALGTQSGNGGSFDACVTQDLQTCRKQAGAQGRSSQLRQ